MTGKAQAIATLMAGLSKEEAEELSELLERQEETESGEVAMLAVPAGFRGLITPKPPEKIVFFQCSKCNGHHFRHAGYMKVMIPVVLPGEDRRVQQDDNPVAICVACKNCYVWINSQMYDVTDKIDLAAWTRTEIEAQRATGPGGNC